MKTNFTLTKEEVVQALQVYVNRQYRSERVRVIDYDPGYDAKEDGRPIEMTVVAELAVHVAKPRIVKKTKKVKEVING